MRKNQAPKNPSHGWRRKARTVATSRPIITAPGTKNVFQRPGDRPVEIIDYQRVRPEAKPQVVRDHARLCLQIIPRGQSLNSESRGGVGGPRHQDGQYEPGCGQVDVECGPPMPQFAKRRYQEDAIVEQDDQRSTDHDLLASHAEGARDGGGQKPPAWACGLGPAQRAVQRQQQEQGHQQFRTLDDVGDAFGLQRVHLPNERNGHCQPCGGPVQSALELFEAECSAQQTEEHQCTRQMQGQVDRVVAADVQPAQGIVQRKRLALHRASFDGEIGGDKHGIPNRPPVMDMGIVADGIQVVENKWPAKAVVIGPDANGDDDQRGNERTQFHVTTQQSIPPRHPPPALPDPGLSPLWTVCEAR